MSSDLTIEQQLTFSSDTIDSVASDIIAFAQDTAVWFFEGEMGAGKTTLIKAIAKHLGIKDTVSSPTYSLVNEYHDTKGEVFYHFDFYRIKSEEEASDIGTDEYFNSDEYCFVEWPSMIPSLWPDEYVVIKIDILSEFERMISLSKKVEQE